MTHKKHLFIHLLFILVMVSSICFGAFANFPMVVNYSRKTYAGGSQIWDISQDSIGRMYFCSNSGLLVFNSRTWHLYSLPYGTTPRACMIDEESQRLYVGSSEEFGYFDVDDQSHSMTYHSLSQQMRQREGTFKEVWNIFKHGQDVWFQSDKIIFRYTPGQKIETVAMPARIQTSEMIGGRLYLALENSGLHELKGSRLDRLTTDGTFRNKKIIRILPWGKDLMVATERDGLFMVVEGVITPFATDIDSFLKENQIFCAAAKGTKLAFGSVFNGLIVKDMSNGNVEYANMATGIQNNTILSLHFDRDDNLWLGLDDGIDFVKLNSIYSNLVSSPHLYGAGYMSHLVGNTLYLGTNQGLYMMAYPPRLQPETPKLPMLIRGQIWDICSVDNTLFVGSDAGLYIGSGGAFRRVENIGGVWSSQQLRKHPDYVLVSTYDGFFLMKNEAGSWRNAGRVAGYSDIGGHFIQDNNGNIWISHWLKGIYRLAIDPEHCKITASQFYDNNSGFPTNHNITVAEVDGNLIFGSDGGFMRFDGKNFNYATDLSHIFAVYGPARLVQAPNRDIWCIAEHKLSVASKSASGGTVVDSVSYSSISPHLIPGFEHLNFISDHHLIVSSQDGFFDVNLQRNAKPAKAPKVIIDRIYTNGDSLLTSAGFDGVIAPLDIEYTYNSLRFEFVSPEYSDDEVMEYSYYLENYEPVWSAYFHNTSKEYTKLREGNYILHVKARNMLTRAISECSLRFTIRPPWYRSTISYIIYAIITTIILILIYFWGRRQIRRQQKRISDRKEAELEEMRRKAQEEALQKDYKIAELKGQQLEQDIKHKAEELSNLTMNVARKNEMLLEISTQLKKIQQTQSQTESNRRISRLLDLIRQNISHDDDWRNFIHNFDAAYEGFTKKLLAKHPDLTMTELRVCCYLKMGLSSKDIAPLFNISFRSVEMTRYRIRKKLNLERPDKLIDYLRQF
ncbi:MAG: triple tyrosine motif-containing protein [Lepagella sp.]